MVAKWMLAAFLLALTLSVATVASALQSHQLGPQPREQLLPGFVKAGDKYYKTLKENAICNGFVQHAVAGGPNESQILFVWRSLDVAKLKPVDLQKAVDYGTSELKVADVRTGLITKIADLPTTLFMPEFFWAGGNAPALISGYVDSTLKHFVVDVPSRRVRLLDAPVRGRRGALFDADAGLILMEITEPGKQQRLASINASGQVVATFDGPGESNPFPYGYEVRAGVIVNDMNPGWAVECRTGVRVAAPPARPTDQILAQLESDSSYRGDIYGLIGNPHPVMLLGLTRKDEKLEVTRAPVALGFWQTIVPENAQYLCLYGPSGLRVMPIQAFSPNEYLDHKKEWVKQDAIYRAKTVGIGLQIYLADYDDQFPPVEGFPDSLLPYLKNREILDGFVYTLNGEFQTKMEKVSETVAGFIDTEYGRAVVRADSSVVWLPKNP